MVLLTPSGESGEIQTPTNTFGFIATRSGEIQTPINTLVLL